VNGTVMLDILAERYGVELIETPIGYAHIAPAMVEHHAMLGGEESGGFAFRGHIPERDGILSGITFADMIVKYGQPLSKIMAHLTELVGPHFYARHDLHLDRQEYAARRAELYGRLEKEPPTEVAGARVARSRTDDGFKYYL